MRETAKMTNFAKRGQNRESKFLENFARKNSYPYSLKVNHFDDFSEMNIYVTFLLVRLTSNLF